MSTPPYHVFHSPSLLFRSCWLSLEGGLLYAFVGPAAAVVLVFPSFLPSLLPPSSVCLPAFMLKHAKAKAVPLNWWVAALLVPFFYFLREI